MTTPTIDLARDAEGHVRLDHAQAAAVARWLADDGYTREDSEIVQAVKAVCVKPAAVLSRYVLDSAAEREQWTTESQRLSPVIWAAVEYDRDPCIANALQVSAAVRAAGLAAKGRPTSCGDEHGHNRDFASIGPV